MDSLKYATHVSVCKMRRAKEDERVDRRVLFLKPKLAGTKKGYSCKSKHGDPIQACHCLNALTTGWLWFWKLLNLLHCYMSFLRLHWEIYRIFQIKAYGTMESNVKKALKVNMLLFVIVTIEKSDGSTSTFQAEAEVDQRKSGYIKPKLDFK